ncbi:MAG: hypothetical protein N2378_01830 [Chloroflexaceae bacterium]|nr:hypothetical protein [Chloroflexaceae bacterium]
MWPAARAARQRQPARYMAPVLDSTRLSGQFDINEDDRMVAMPGSRRPGAPPQPRPGAPPRPRRVATPPDLCEVGGTDFNRLICAKT